MMNDSWGKVHFFFTFVLLNCVFYPMHILGMRGFPRRLADPYHYETFHDLLPLNQFISWCAFLLVGVQIIFIINFLLEHLLRPAVRPESVARQRPGVAGAQPAGPRQLRLPADHLPRPVRVRLAGDGRGLLPADAAADGAGSPASRGTSDCGFRIADCELSQSEIRNSQSEIMNRITSPRPTRLSLAPSLGLAVGVRDVSAGVVGRVRDGDRLGDGVSRLAHLRRRVHAALSVAQLRGRQVHRARPSAARRCSRAC